MVEKVLPSVLTIIAIAVSISIIIISIVNARAAPFPIGWSPESRVQLAFGISALAIAIISLIYLIVKGNFSELIKDEKKYPSLALFQFLVWTIIITFAYFGIYLTRIFGSELGLPPEIPSNLLVLMGISVAVPILNKQISDKKYANVPPADAVPPASRPLPSTLLSMLQENGQLSLTRFQMFAWTWIGIIIYLFLLYFTVNTEMGNVKQLSLPNIDGTIVFLMGLSQAAYLGKKMV